MSSTNIRLLLTCFVFIKSVSPLTMHTEDVLFQDSDSIILNCTYHKDDIEYISDRCIRWQKLIDDEFKDIAIFSPPGGQKPFIVMETQRLYNNRIELIAPNISLTAVIIIKDPLCSDQGVYQCWIEYYSYFDSYNFIELQTSRSNVTFKAKPKEPEEFLVFPIELEENKNIELTCSADVGSPLGNIHIWKISQYSNTPELIYLSNAISNKTEHCTEFINVHLTYTVTRDDNRALLRCSSHNNLTQGLGPSKESSTISVIYGPDEPEITMTPSKSLYFVGDSLTIQCLADSNPPSVFFWSFQSYNKSVITLIEISLDKLEFDSLQTSNSGTYICTATNAARSNSPNVTSFVSLYVKHSESSYQDCKQCGYLSVCQQYNGNIECVTNKWAPIAVVFILISVSFAVASIVLIKNKKKRSKTRLYSNYIVPTQSAPQDDGGYQTHPDLANTHVYSSLQSHKQETGEYTSLQSRQPETGVYTSLQSHKSETGEYTSLQSHQPETGVYTSLQSYKPETGEYTSLQSHQPETGEYTSLQSHQPETGENTSLKSHQPEIGEYTSLQSHQPETGDTTALQSHQPETGDITALQSNQPETGENISLKSHQPETGESTSLQSRQPETGDTTALQSHQPETGDITALQSLPPQTG